MLDPTLRLVLLTCFSLNGALQAQVEPAFNCRQGGPQPISVGPVKSSARHLTLSPTAGPAGTQVVIHGRNFTSNETM